MVGCLALGGCSRNPNIEISGSFFPAWLIALLAGILGTFVLRGILMKAGLHESLTPPLLVYGCLALSLTLLAWLLFFA